MDNTAYLLGRLTAALDADERIVYRACTSPLALVPLIGQTTQDPTGRERIAPLMEQLGEFPEALNNEQQGRFMLGYFHQCHAERTGKETPVAAPSGDARLEVRLSEDLKAWTLANGGAKLVRSLLYAAKERTER